MMHFKTCRSEERTAENILLISLAFLFTNEYKYLLGWVGALGIILDLILFLLGGCFWLAYEYIPFLMAF